MAERHAVLMSPAPDGNAGGVERFCWLLARLLEGQGWQTSTVGPRSQPGRWTYRLGGAPLHWSISTGRAVRAAARAGTGPQGAEPDRAPDLVVGNGFLGLGSPRARARIQVFHGTSAAEILATRPSIMRRDYVRRLASYWPLEALMCRAGELVVVSESAAAETRRYYGHRASHVIPNGVDVGLFAPRDRAAARERLGLAGERPLALFVGRPEYRKGADLLIESCEAAGWELVHAGGRGIAGARNLGVLEPSALADAYAAADCMLFPTRYEACSFVILEALASGTPVLTTRVGWMRTLLDAVPAYAAFCVRPDRDDVVTRLRWLHGADTDGAVAQARAFVLEHNSLERFNAHWLDLIRRLVG